MSRERCVRRRMRQREQEKAGEGVGGRDSGLAGKVGGDGEGEGVRVKLILFLTEGEGEGLIGVAAVCFVACFVVVGVAALEDATESEGEDVTPVPVCVDATLLVGVLAADDMVVGVDLVGVDLVGVEGTGRDTDEGEAKKAAIAVGLTEYEEGVEERGAGEGEEEGVMFAENKTDFFS